MSRTSGKASGVAASLGPAAGYSFAVIAARFNEAITGRLKAGALAALAEAQVAAPQIVTVDVPGAFELPQAAHAAAATGRFDAVVCLGCVIRGETAHFEYISSSVAHALQQVAIGSAVPVVFGVLTTDTWEQAEARAGDGRDNKGFEAAAAAIEMARLFRRLRTGGAEA